MSKVLLIIEHDNQTLKQTNYSMLAAAQQLSHEIDVMIGGYQCHAVVEQAKSLPTIKKIKVADAEVYQHQLAENMSSLIVKYASEYQYILAPATTFGKNLLPRIAGLLDVGMIADVVKIISPQVFVRPIYAGNAFATVESQEKIKCLTIRSTGFLPATAVSTASIPVEEITDIIPNTLTTFVKQELTVSKRPELTSAKIVISGGRGLKNAENFKLLEELADCLGAAVGASRAAVDAGFAPNDYQVGQTGKIVAPDLYIAVGISGAIQHLAGMKDSKVIVAINSDPDAPIFQIADYGLVSDLFTALEQLKTELC